jgi:transcriptional regulator with XRE-family HTH domain
MPTSGKALRTERRRYEITATDLAARMGLSRQTVWVIERSGAVDPSRVEQYRAALASLRDATEASEETAA